MNASLGIAMLGCGHIAKQHSRMLRSLDPAVRVYGASRFPARSEDFARDTRADGWFASYDAALAAPHIDAVLVATPPLHHLARTLSALAAGKHVIVEKPAFSSPADCRTVARTAADAGRQVLVAENYAYKPLARVLQDVIGSGEIGDVRFVLLNALKYRRASDWRDDAELAGGGALFEGGVHWIDLPPTSDSRWRACRASGPATSAATSAAWRWWRSTRRVAWVLLHSWETPSCCGASPVQGDRVAAASRSSRTGRSRSSAAVIRVWWSRHCAMWAATARCCVTSAGAHRGRRAAHDPRPREQHCADPRGARNGRRDPSANLVVNGQPERAA
jgi:hypothetical protein